MINPIMEQSYEDIDRAPISDIMEIYCKKGCIKAITARQSYEWSQRDDRGRLSPERQRRRDLGDIIYNMMATRGYFESKFGGDQAVDLEDISWIPNFLCLLYLLGMWSLYEQFTERVKEIDPSQKDKIQDFTEKARQTTMYLRKRFQMADIPSNCIRLKDFKNLIDLAPLAPDLRQEEVLLEQDYEPRPLYTDTDRNVKLSDRIKQQDRNKAAKSAVAITATAGIVWALIKISKTISDKKYRKRRRNHAYRYTMNAVTAQ